MSNPVGVLPNVTVLGPHHVFDVRAGPFAPRAVSRAVGRTVFSTLICVVEMCLHIGSGMYPSRSGSFEEKFSYQSRPAFHVSSPLIWCLVPVSQHIFLTCPTQRGKRLWNVFHSGLRESIYLLLSLAFPHSSSFATNSSSFRNLPVHDRDPSAWCLCKTSTVQN